MEIFEQYIVFDQLQNCVVSDHDNISDAEWSVNTNNGLTDTPTRFVIYSKYPLPNPMNEIVTRPPEGWAQASIPQGHGRPFLVWLAGKRRARLWEVVFGTTLKTFIRRDVQAWEYIDVVASPDEMYDVIDRADEIIHV